MGKRLYVGGIPFQAGENELKDIFSKIGEVESVRVITDSYSGQSKGFGFVEMVSEADAQKAISELDGSTFMERTLIVNEARPQQQRERSGGGRSFGDNRRGPGGGGGGGFGGGRGSRPGGGGGTGGRGRR